MYSRIEEKIKLHIKYWERDTMRYPLAAFRIAPDFFVSTHFSAARKLLIPDHKIKADMVNVDEFIENYQEMILLIDQIDQDAFWTIEPFVGFPWMEAICGCEVTASSDSFITKPCLSEIKSFENVELSSKNAWYRKFIEFTDKLSFAFENRFPVGQPILRGVTDVAGALLGQEKMVYSLYDYPNDVKNLMCKINYVFLMLVKEQQERIQPFHGGYSMGFYHLWCPGKCVWFQEDLTSLMTPGHYKEFVKDTHEKICERFDYTAIHLHSSSFHLLDQIFEVKGLKAIEINKDTGGLTISQMIPVFRKIQAAGRNLIIWGDIGTEDIDCIKDNLEMKGVFLSIVAPSIEAALHINEHIKK